MWIIWGLLLLMQLPYSTGSVRIEHRTTTSMQPKTLPSEVQSLCDFYNKTNGQNWNWNETAFSYSTMWNCSHESTSDPCTDKWQGVSCFCGSIDCTVTNLIFSDMSLSGDEYLNLSLDNLTEFELYGSTNLSSKLPIFTSTRLVSIRLNKCNFSGSIPDSYSNLKNLRIFRVPINAITGTIPSFIGEWRSLEWLSFNTNRMHGTIPSALGNLTNLERISLQVNNFIKNIPTEIYGLQAIKLLRLYNNSLTGRIPTSLTLMTNLKNLELNSNYFSGTLPREIGNLQKLETFTFNDNKFSGTLPQSITNILSLQIMYAQRNRFEGSLPKNFNKLSNLTTLVLAGNYFSGSLSNAFSTSMASLEIVDLSDNKFSGRIPAMFNSSKLKYFLVSVNCFEEIVPREICLARNLEFLSIFALGSSDKYVR